MPPPATALPLPRPKRLRVGIVGAGEVTQVVHLPTLTYMRDWYDVVALCDVSREAREYVADKWKVPRTFANSAELCAQSDIDVVVVANSDEYHFDACIEALQARKHVFVEKPLCLLHSEADRLVRASDEAERQSGTRLSVGYMRRYAPAFETFKRLLAESGPIRHVLVKDIGGPNPFFVSQSATFPYKFGVDVSESDRAERERRARAILQGALPDAKARSPRLAQAFRLLGSLGSHDLSFMREALGGRMPSRCSSAFASHDGQFVSAQFEYDGWSAAGGGGGGGGGATDVGSGRQDGAKPQPPFSVLFTIGIHGVGTFESCLEVWTHDRVLRIDIDTPYVKGLPVGVVVKENDAEGRFVQSHVRTSYKDAYTAEFEELHRVLTEKTSAGTPAGSTTRTSASIKTGAADAAQELRLFDMIMERLEA